MEIVIHMVNNSPTTLITHLQEEIGFFEAVKSAVLNFASLSAANWILFYITDLMVNGSICCKVVIWNSLA